MINLFNIPNYKIDTADFNHYLHSTHVKEFEDNFCEYVGAKYACSVNSATSAISATSATGAISATSTISATSASSATGATGAISRHIGFGLPNASVTNVTTVKADGPVQHVRARRRCTNCEVIGHNKRQCPEPPMQVQAQAPGPS